MSCNDQQSCKLAVGCSRFGIMVGVEVGEDVGAVEAFGSNLMEASDHKQDLNRAFRMVVARAMFPRYSVEQLRSQSEA